jgi:hypothetical protein
LYGSLGHVQSDLECPERFHDFQRERESGTRDNFADNLCEQSSPKAEIEAEMFSFSIIRREFEKLSFR